MEIKKLAGAVSAVALMAGVCGLAPAAAADGEVFGLQQTVTDAGGGEIGYTVTKFVPSSDAIPYAVTGRLYEVTVRADALNGMPTPVIPAFSATGPSGQSYPALAGVWTPQTLSTATLLPGGHSTGKVYFDAVGEAPTSVVYNNAGTTLTWTEAPAEGTEGGTAAEEKSAPAEEKAPADAAAPEEKAAPEAGAADTEANADAATAGDEG